MWYLIFMFPHNPFLLLSWRTKIGINTCLRQSCIMSSASSTPTQLNMILEPCSDLFLYGMKHTSNNNSLMRPIRFDNSKNLEVNKILARDILKVPTRKFLPLFYQIASRMSEKGEKTLEKFQEILSIIFSNYQCKSQSI